ncbi:MAG: TIR domain-containing protein [Anaerolineales bacterium]|nr:TIR domain-containing protein [Anaerolineales bacterium]
MKSNIFISYSRQCIGFVDDLVHNLEKRGFNHIWLDYLSLVPGRAWNGQIEKGLEQSDLLLLVVSPESISSRSVEIEWRHFLEKKKRIILLIFQAVTLPKELEQLEWVDFRGGFSSALKKLLKLIESRTPMKKSTPQSGFKAPLTVWLAILFGVITSIYSVFAFWTFLIPLVLLPLPYRILKRDFNLSQAQTALWTLPIALFFTFALGLELGMINENADFDSSKSLLYNIILFLLFAQVFFIPIISFLELILLRSPAMQRWGRPEASVPKFANLYSPNISQPKSVRYYIDYAPQDSKIAHELDIVLKKYSHTPVDDIQSADEVLVLLSRFKTDTQANPEKQVVYPILLQRTKISEKLSPMQWIDFRKGIRNLDAIAQLLPEPEKLLKALGVLPTTSGQAAMPNIVLAWVDFLIILGMVNVGSIFSYIIELMNLHLGFIIENEPLTMLKPIFLLFFIMVLVGWLIYFMVRGLSQRQGRMSSPILLGLGFFAIFFLVTWQGVLGADLDLLFIQYGIPSDAVFSVLPLFTFVIGGFILGVASLFNLRTLRCWFPAKV